MTQATEKAIKEKMAADNTQALEKQMLSIFLEMQKLRKGHEDGLSKEAR